MDAMRFSSNSPGHLFQIAEGHVAFVPNPLPERLDLPPPSVKLLEEARGALGELAGLGRMLPSHHLLRPFVRREAILSSQIEGTFTTIEQLMLFEANPTGEVSPTREVANYVIALEYGLERIKSLPLSLRLIRELHERLLAGVRGEDTIVGEFRRSQNYIGIRGRPIADARFVPPPVPQMSEALNQLESYIHADVDVPVLPKIALVHYQLETIHPFQDGNGRIGRLLIVLQLCAQGLLPAPLLYLSAYFDNHRDAYMDLLLNISQTGEWIDWIYFFLRGVAEQSIDAIDRSTKILALQKAYQGAVQTPRSSALLPRLVDYLFESPVITNAFAQRFLAITARSAQLNIDKLVLFGILEEITGQSRNRVYVARGILEVINAPPSPFAELVQVPA